MNLTEEISAGNSKEMCMRIVEWVGNAQDRFDELIELFFTAESRIMQRAAWPVSYCVMAHPGLICTHFGRLVANLRRPGLHNAIKRNTIRLLQSTEIPEPYQGEIMDICFQYITSPKEAAAVKAFSLTVLGNLSRVYPDIVPEIKLVIEERWSTETPAFRSRARRFLAGQNTKE